MQSKIFVSGSLAYDRIMDFSGYFADHILPEQTHALNVSFTVNGSVEKFGGTAGNIAYALSLLGETPIILATIGHDYTRYFDWLNENQIASDNIKIIKEEFTAVAYITTDKSNNQITWFNPGAMKYPSSFSFENVDVSKSQVLIGPGNLDDMIDYSEACKDRSIGYIFDPGQSLPMWNKRDLIKCIDKCRVLISNSYELELILSLIECDIEELLKLTTIIVTTLGKQGSRICTPESKIEIPAAQPLNVVDPTGAGDAYRAGLIKGLIEGKDIAMCARMGSVSASFAIEHYGTQEYRFKAAEYDRRLNKLIGEAH
jgi:adenosine kinase